MTINRFIDGFKAFQKTYYKDRPDFYRTLIEKGQHPEAMIIACADSRADPCALTNADPGELFIVRNVANTVPPYEPDGNHHGTSAAIEFAVRDLKVKHIIVLGHSHCGGIRRLCEGSKGNESREFIDDWVSIIDQARDTDFVGEDLYRHAERQGIIVSLKNLQSFPWIKSQVDEGKIELHGWWFDMELGELMTYDIGEDWKHATEPAL